LKPVTSQKKNEYRFIVQPKFVNADLLYEASYAAGNGSYFWVDHVNQIAGVFILISLGIAE